MQRYFLELSYKGTGYSGFQVQENAKTIQSQVESAMQTFYRKPFALTGSSRTDAGVHALQNFFHFDTDLKLVQKDIYNLNAILPPDIAATAYYKVDPASHCRFGAISREYRYVTYGKKNPFSVDRGWYYPFKIDQDILEDLAQFVENEHDFLSFSKRNTQVNNFRCNVFHSSWQREHDQLIYHIKGNRFLRGMVRALVSSMLKTARGTLPIEWFRGLVNTPVHSAADFSAPAHGLFLVKVEYPDNYLHLID